MKKSLAFVFLMMSGMNVYSQIIFEKGYYIDNSGEKIECLIKNVDWRNNPMFFEYKLSGKAKEGKLTIDSVREFGIYDISKYVRDTVKMDRSSRNFEEMSLLREAEFKKEGLFLKVLVEGKADLYYYRDGSVNRYFYSINGSGPEQLIYKKYRIDLSIGENNKFRQQLWKDMNCREASLESFGNLEYQKKDLMDFFVEYNQCENSQVVSFENKKNRDWFNLSVRPGLNIAKLSMEKGPYPYGNVDFGNRLGFRIGVEAEFILPFNKNKWAIFIEPTYQHYAQEQEITVVYLDESLRETRSIVKANYRSIEFPIGLRHYFFLGKEAKIFANIAYIVDLAQNSSIDFEAKRVGDVEITTGNNFGIGIGYKQNDKYSVELRYQTNRQVSQGHPIWNSKYHTFSIILGYTIL